MRQLPKFLQSFQKEAERLIASQAILDIEFSGSTYQIQIYDAGKDQEAWPFIQLDSQGNIKDCFCSCEAEGSQCVHLASGFLAIYNDQEQPLHQRFQDSLWNKLCEIFAGRIGDNVALLEEINPGHYVRFSSGNKILFSIQKKTAEGKLYLKELLDNRSRLTEENSLKFSKLSQEELIQWRAGRPSLHLRYLLSFWSDIAHWLMMMQERHLPYQIKFKHSDKEIPNQIVITFPDVEISFYLSESYLPLIIPSLATVESPLKVYQGSIDSIADMRYDQKKGVLNIKLSKTPTPHTQMQGKGYSLQGWNYVKNEGFYSVGQHPLLASSQLTEDQITKALKEYPAVIQKKLTDAAAHLDAVSLSYHVHFDAGWNLHVEAYLFHRGDLMLKHSKQYGEWVYLENDGFYRIKKPHFQTNNFSVAASAVDDFISEEKGWLNQQKGLHVHVSSFETQLSYTLDKENRLHFHKNIHSDALGKGKEFRAWICIPEHGFYAKKADRTGFSKQQNYSIGQEQIPLFIRANRAELEQINQFFSQKCPISDLSLKITVDKDVIYLAPQYQLLPEYKNKDVRFFEDVLYVAEEGFYELPAHLRLPEPYSRPVTIEGEEIDPFLSTTLETLHSFISELDPQIVPPKYLHLVATSILPLEEGRYLLNMNYETDRGLIPISKIWQALKKKRQYLLSKQGRLDLHTPQFDWIRKLSKEQLDRATNSLYLTTIELIRLNALENILPKNSEAALPLEELIEFRVPREPNLAGLKSQLRTYQKYGVDWLWFLYQHGLSGLLCDDMGLGKTHQAMALLAAISNHFKDSSDKKRPLHFLIVCPTSVLFHWQEKLAEFLPHLRVCIFYGSDRSLEQFHSHYDILLTSYGLWRLESSLLSKTSYELAIFDEIQIAKNQNSRIHMSLLKVKARMKLGLTGTPIENRLRELKSLFDLVLPTYMPGEMEYRKLFTRPIERENDEKKRILLRKFIKPFIVRRKKEEVLFDLPEKIEEIAHCELSADQQQLYHQTLHQSRTKLLKQLQDPQATIPYLHIFALLSGLKQICDHPAVFLKNPGEYESYESGKWDLFLELLHEARDSQQKVVIFSQYLDMLDIFVNYFNKEGIEFASIRGSTLDRGAQVYRFNHDSKCEVFLGSLQAAGLGVDLTAGSVVIHYDRWWNAARENQATDRVHRIGQTRGVQVFKLVTRWTFEERIDALIRKKPRLLEEVVSIDDHRFMKHFSRDELIQLLQDVAEDKSL